MWTFAWRPDRAAHDFLAHPREAIMRANVGDRLHVLGRQVGSPEHIGQILEVRGAEGAPPYLVRFDDGHEGLCFPGPDSVIEAAGAGTRTEPAGTA